MALSPKFFPASLTQGDGKMKEVKIKAKIHKNLKYIEIDGETYVKDTVKIKNLRSKQKETR